MLVLRLAFMLLLYLFLFAVFLVIRRDLQVRAGPRPRRVRPVAKPGPASRLVLLAAGDSGRPPGEQLPLAPITTLGRSADCEIRLDDGFVSSRHARLRLVDGSWLLADLGSTNGTRLNDRPLEGERVVDVGDVIGLGDVRLRLAN